MIDRESDARGEDRTAVSPRYPSSPSALARDRIGVRPSAPSVRETPVTSADLPVLEGTQLVVDGNLHAASLSGDDSMVKVDNPVGCLDGDVPIYTSGAWTRAAPMAVLPQELTLSAGRYMSIIDCPPGQSVLTGGVTPTGCGGGRPAVASARFTPQSIHSLWRAGRWLKKAPL